MIEMTTNSTDHSSEIAPYAALGRTCEATAKYAKVNRPVDAIPIDRPRARSRPPRRSPPRRWDLPGETTERSPCQPTALAQAYEEHRPRERRARLDDLAVAREQRHERALRPVVEVAGRVAEVAQVRAAGHVQRTPQRRARDRHEQPPRRHARHLGKRVLGVGHVLENLDRGRDLELAVRERQVLGLHHAVLEVRRAALLPLGVQRRVVEVDPDDALVAETLRPLLGEHAL